ncbi:Dual specificity protein phosphatase 18 [Chionoecetes opilio]|uniref:Dual specificity protein phosphatase 18 n=1 Tax=Chionoecetes opilio TaxID=41210 RepID=A0A8J4YCL2_CHIOP|nr:Dual specificity protein phosphatase 18 [Chionoecetes opilio]
MTSDVWHIFPFLALTKFNSNVKKEKKCNNNNNNGHHFDPQDSGAHPGTGTASRRAPGCEGAMGLSQVWEGLWVGAARVITSHLLASHGITTLVWATPEVQVPPLQDDLHVVKVLVKDEATQDLGPHLPIVAQAFRECRGRGEGMAVVCRAGKSRSAALALAALVALPEAAPTLRDAYVAVKAARPLIRPNPGFFAQLIQYEEEVRGAASMAMEENPYSEARELLPAVYVEELRKAVCGGTFTTFVPL